MRGSAVTAEILLVLTTCGDAETAAKLAQSLVSQQLAACVNEISGVTSTYRWEGKTERADETMLVIKTTPERYDAVEAQIRAISSYELPEIIAVRPEGGLDAYLEWVSEETQQR